MEKDKDIIEVIIDEQPTNNKKIKFAYWDNLAKDLSPLFIKVSSAVCIMIVLGVFFVGFFIPKNDNKITKRLEKLQNTNSEYITAQNNYSSLSDEINTLRVFIPQETIYVRFEFLADETFLTCFQIHDEEAV